MMMRRMRIVMMVMMVMRMMRMVNDDDLKWQGPPLCSLVFQIPKDTNIFT